MGLEVQSALITRLLQEAQTGDRDAEAKLFEALYPELKRLARFFLSGERANQTLQPTAVVNEAYIKLVGNGGSFSNRTHFFAVASLIIRQILADHARKRSTVKHGGNRVKVELEERFLIDDASIEVVLAVDEALDQLQVLDSRQAQIVQMRFFGGLTENEVAEYLGINVRTVRRDWQLAKAWLSGVLGDASQRPVS